jgi:hypothetical protein
MECGFISTLYWNYTGKKCWHSYFEMSGIYGGQSGAGAGFSPSTSVSPANLYSTNFSTITITYHPGLVQ